MSKDYINGVIQAIAVSSSPEQIKLLAATAIRHVLMQEITGGKETLEDLSESADRLLLMSCWADERMKELAEGGFSHRRADKVRICQMKDDDENAYRKFISYERLTENGGEIDPSVYEEVYSYTEPSGFADLNEIYERFNLNHPRDFVGHSLSVSDVIVLEAYGIERWFYVDRIGFEEIVPGRHFLCDVKYKPDTIRALLIAPDREPMECEIADTLDALQYAVGGHIETCQPIPRAGKATIICNEEGKMRGLSGNIFIKKDGKLLDMIVGTALIVNSGEEDFEDLNDAQVTFYKDLYSLKGGLRP